MPPRDVHPRMLARHDALLRQQTQLERAQGVQRLWEAMQHMAWLNVRRRHPAASEPLLIWLKTELMYDRQTAERILGARPVS